LLRKVFYIIFFGFLLSGCAESETRSIVSSDLNGNKYRSIAVFVENSDPAKPTASPSFQANNGTFVLFIPTPTGSSTDAEIERKVVTAMGGVGVRASSGPALFNEQTLNNKAKANILQKNFDAVLYVTVLTNGMREEPIGGAYFDGQNVVFQTGVVTPLDQLTGVSVKADGGVWGQVPTFQAKCDLQDTKTNKIVWSSETIASGGTAVLLSRAADQIVAKMRSDGAI
jgi:hypothetical protein